MAKRKKKSLVDLSGHGQHAESSSSDEERAQRCRYKGTPTDLAAILRPFVTRANWITYAEEKEKVKADMILPQKNAVRALHANQTNLSYPKGTVRRALGILEKEKRDTDVKWCLPKESRTDWITKCQTRMFWMCRHVQQAIVKGKGAPPQWVKMLELTNNPMKAEDRDMNTEALSSAGPSQNATKKVAQVVGFTTRCRILKMQHAL